MLTSWLKCVRNAILASLVLHCILFAFISYSFKRTRTQDIVPLQVVFRSKSVPKLPAVRGPVRVGSSDFAKQPLNLGVHAAAQHYIDRLRAHIEPHWRRLVAEGIAQKTLAHTVCSTVLHIDADAKGTVMVIVVASSTCNKKLDTIAKSAILYSGLLPPPKELLKDSVLYLQWTFSLKDKP